MSKNTRKNTIALLQQHQAFAETDDGFEATQQVYRDFLLQSTAVLNLPELGKVAGTFKKGTVGQWYRCKAASKICYQLAQADDLSKDADLSDPYRQDLHEALNAEQWNADSYKPVIYDGVSPYQRQAFYAANLALDFYGLPKAADFQPIQLAWMIGGNGMVEPFTVGYINNQAAKRVGRDVAEGRIDVRDTQAQDTIRKHYIEEGLAIARAEAQFRRQNVLETWHFMCDNDGEAEALRAIADGYDGKSWEELRNEYILGIAAFANGKLNEARDFLNTSYLSRPLMQFQRDHYEEAVKNIEKVLITYTGGVGTHTSTKQAEINAVVERLQKMSIVDVRF